MQYFETIHITQNALIEVISSGGDKTEIIANELESHIYQISSLLTSYHWHEKGVVEKVEIQKDAIQLDQQGEGRFKVKYAINIHYGCSDMDIDLDKKMTIGITVNLQTGETVLTGEHIPEREPDGF